VGAKRGRTALVERRASEFRARSSRRAVCRAAPSVTQTRMSLRVARKAPIAAQTALPAAQTALPAAQTALPAAQTALPAAQNTPQRLRRATSRSTRPPKRAIARASPKPPAPSNGAAREVCVCGAPPCSHRYMSSGPGVCVCGRYSLAKRTTLALCIALFALHPCSPLYTHVYGSHMCMHVDHGGVLPADRARGARRHSVRVRHVPRRRCGLLALRR